VSNKQTFFAPSAVCRGSFLYQEKFRKRGLLVNGSTIGICCHFQQFCNYFVIIHKSGAKISIKKFTYISDKDNKIRYGIYAQDLRDILKANSLEGHFIV
jgi:hypothetical protein